MKIRLATLDDLPTLTHLEQYANDDELAPSQQGASAVFFKPAQLQQLIQQQQIVVAEAHGKIIGYLLSGGWSMYQDWRLQQQALRCYQQSHAQAAKQSCHYGPVWVEKSFRRQGIARQMRHLLIKQLTGKYQNLVAIVAEDNQASMMAHVDRGDMQICDHFEFAGQGFYLLAQAIR